MSTPFRKLLSDKNDKIAFAISFIIGIGGILTIRLLGDFEVLAIVFAVGVIAIYTLFIALNKDRSGISLDRASDNIYYLGLLFTLTSLAYSLIKLKVGNTASAGLVLDLLPDFGLALFSTIAGIFFRILLQQMRNEPMEVGTETREQMGIAINQLRETINQMIMNIGNLSTQSSVAITELNQTVYKSLEDSAKTNTKVISGVADEIGTLSSQIQEQITEITNFTEALTDQINNMHSKLQGIGKMPEILQEKLQTLSDKLSENMDQIEATASTLEEYGERIETSVNAVDEANSEYIEELSKAAKKLRTETDKK